MCWFNTYKIENYKINYTNEILNLWNEEVGFIFPISEKMFNQKINECKYFNEKLMWLKLNLYFKDENVDIAVIETGIGGLLDDTNIISPLVSLITNVNYDVIFRQYFSFTALTTFTASSIPFSFITREKVQSL